MTTTDASEPETIQVRGDELRPHLHGVWCSIQGGECFVNTIMMIRWRDLNTLSIMLDSHNFMSVRPDELVDVVVRELRPAEAAMVAGWTLAPPPKPHEALLNTLRKLPPEDLRYLFRELGVA